MYPSLIAGGPASRRVHLLGPGTNPLWVFGAGDENGADATGNIIKLVGTSAQGVPPGPASARFSAPLFDRGGAGQNRRPRFRKPRHSGTEPLTAALLQVRTSLLLLEMTDWRHNIRGLFSLSFNIYCHW